MSNDIKMIEMYLSQEDKSLQDYIKTILKSFKEDDNVVSQLIGIMGQDLVYSVPIYNKLIKITYGIPISNVCWH